MSDLPANDEGNFMQRLRKLQSAGKAAATDTEAPDLGQWLQYWNDADSVAGNLRKLEHWLQRGTRVSN